MFSKAIFGERLRVIRIQNHKKSADSLGVTPISKMKNRKQKTTINRLALICGHNNVSANYFSGRTDAFGPT